MWKSLKVVFVELFQVSRFINMKYRNFKPYLTYALNKDGDLVHIDSVPNGNDCACICPHCKSDLCAKNAGSESKKVHHFAHVSGVDCVGAVESALHKMAKDVMKETLCLQLPDRLDGSYGELLKFDRVEVEFYDKDTRLRPDCIGYYGDKVIWVEFKRTHAVDAKKKGKIISAKIDCVELDLNVCELNPEAVRNFIMNERKNRIWIRDCEQNTRITGIGLSYASCYNDQYGYIERFFAKDENDRLVNLLEDNFDTNIHNYYCLACGKELTIDVNESGRYFFVHIDNVYKCDDDLYLHEAAKDIIQYKFYRTDDFKILVPQYKKCEEKTNCAFFQPDLCSIEKGISYDLKLHGYTECLKDYKFQDLIYKSDLVIKTADSTKNAIIISINAGSCHVEIDTKEYRVIDIEVSNNNELFSLLNDPIGCFRSTFLNFKNDNENTASRSEMNREVLKFSLFSSGKYFVDTIPCNKVNEHKNTTILEYIFIDRKHNKYDAKLYSLIRCYEQKRKVCFCEICWFIAKTNDFYGISETICKRYKTKGTPHYPLDEMPIDCPYFKINKEIENIFRYTDKNVVVKEKFFNK